jgi:suppressor of ftsI
MDMTNLHFHGLTVSPDAPQDDVLGMMAMPGQSLRYTVQIPKDHPPGLYWYHTHPHGESHRQGLDGMSGALVIEGIESYFSPLSGLPERVLVVHGRSLVNDPQSVDLKHRVELSSDICGAEPEAPEEIFTVNGSVRPQIRIAPGEHQFWRLVNASADRYLDLQLEGQVFEIVAMDGMPIALHDPNHRTRSAEHVLLPPAGRLEAIVTGPAAGMPKRLVSRCVDTGPDGDPNPAMVLADIVSRSAAGPIRKTPETHVEPGFRTLDLAAEEKAPPRFIVSFTEDKKAFYINGKVFTPDAAPMGGLSPEEICELTSVDLTGDDVLVFYTDGVTKAENRLGEEFGMDRLSATVRRGSSLSAEDLMVAIYNTAADFCGDDFSDDVTIVVVKCDFEGSPALTS